MKNNLFELLLNLFEQTLTQLKDRRSILKIETESNSFEADDGEDLPPGLPVSNFKSPSQESIRIFSPIEQAKLTKSSYQFLMRINALGILSPDVFEMILNQLLLSESHYVCLQETKWIIRYTLASSLDPEQLAFLDLLLYHREDELSMH